MRGTTIGAPPCFGIEDRESRRLILIFCDGFSTVEMTNLAASTNYSRVRFKLARQPDQVKSSGDMQRLKAGQWLCSGAP
jgi:hypothetical protein